MVQGTAQPSIASLPDIVSHNNNLLSCNFEPDTLSVEKHKAFLLNTCGYPT